VTLGVAAAGATKTQSAATRLEQTTASM